MPQPVLQEFVAEPDGMVARAVYRVGAQEWWCLYGPMIRLRWMKGHVDPGPAEWRAVYDAFWIELARLPLEWHAEHARLWRVDDSRATPELMDERGADPYGIASVVAVVPSHHGGR